MAKKSTKVNNPSVHLNATDLRCYQGDTFVLRSTVFNAGEQPVTYSWTKDGQPIHNQTKPTLTDSHDMGTGVNYTYICKITVGGTEYSSTPCKVTYNDKPKGMSKVFDVKFNERNQIGYTSLPYHILQHIDSHVPNQSAQSAEFTDKLTQLIAALDSHKLYVERDMIYSFLRALLLYSDLDVQDSRDGYRNLYRLEMSQGPQYKRGRMINYWKPEVA